MRSQAYMNLSLYWDTEVKPLAQACLDTEVLKLFSVTEETVTPEDKKKGEELAEKYIDTTAMWYVSQFVWAMEHDLADDNIYLKAVNSTLQVNGTLSSDSYWKNVWGGRAVGNKEAVRLIKLRDSLPKLLDLITARGNMVNVTVPKRHVPLHTFKADIDFEKQKITPVKAEKKE